MLHNCPPALGNTSYNKNVFFQAPERKALSPIRASCTTFFVCQKRLTRITEPSNDDYNNDVSDNCDHNFGTFDDFGVKNEQKVSHNMILMSKYKGQPGGEKGKKNRARPSPPLFGQCLKEIDFFMGGVP